MRTTRLLPALCGVALCASVTAAQDLPAIKTAGRLRVRPTGGPGVKEAIAAEMGFSSTR